MSATGGEAIVGTATEKSQHAGWNLHVDTELANNDWQSALRGGHVPQALALPIFAASTYRLENATEGGELCNSMSEVFAQFSIRFACI